MSRNYLRNHFSAKDPRTFDLMHFAYCMHLISGDRPSIPAATLFRKVNIIVGHISPLHSLPSKRVVSSICLGEIPFKHHFAGQNHQFFEVNCSSQRRHEQPLDAAMKPAPWSLPNSPLRCYAAPADCRSSAEGLAAEMPGPNWFV